MKQWIHLGQNPGKQDPMDLLIPGLGQGASNALGRGTEGSVKLHQNPRNFVQERVFPLFLGPEGSEKGVGMFESLAWSHHGIWEQHPGRDRTLSSIPRVSLVLGFSFQSPGGEAAPKIPQRSQVSSSGIGSSAGSGGCLKDNAPAEATRGWGHQDVTHSVV